MFEQFSKEELAVVAASVAALGVLLAAFINFISSGRSKYVDVIAAQRIKWVDDLRNDVLDFTTALDGLIYCVQRKIYQGEEYDKHLDKAMRRLQLVQMKMNLDKSLDNQLIDLMGRELHYARCGDYENFSIFAELRTRTTYDLLKEEWEKAKSEAAGPLRWIWLWLKGVARRHRRRVYWSHPDRRSYLQVVRRGYSEEELAARFSLGEENPTVKAGQTGTVTN